MTNSNILFIGMDVHKESIEIAIADGTSQEVRRYGKIGGTQDAMRKTLRKLVSQGKKPAFLLRSWPLWLRAVPLSGLRRPRLLGSGTVDDSKEIR